MDFRRSKSSYKLKPTDREAKLFSWATAGKSGVGGGGDDGRYSNLYYDLIPGVMDPSKDRDQGVSSQVARNDSVVVSPLFNPDTTSVSSSVREEANEKKKDSDGSSSSDEKEDLWAQWGVVRQGNVPLADALGGRRDNTSRRDGASGLSTSVQTMKTNQARSRSDKYKPQSSPLDGDAGMAIALREDSGRRLHPLIDLGSLTSPPKSVKPPPTASKLPSTASKPPSTASNTSTSHHPSLEYSMNIGGMDRSSGVPQSRSLIETERTRQSRAAAASHKADSSSRIVRY